MEFKEVVKNRYACRQYLEKKVPEEIIRELIEIMGYAVSAINLQPWKVKVVSDQPTKDRLFEATWSQSQVKTCSHLLVLCADVDYPAIIAKFDKTLAAAGVDAEMRSRMVEMASGVASGMSAEQKLQWSQNQVHIMLGNAVNGAYSLGLASCPMTAFQPGEFAKILGLPETIVPTALVAVG
ncbi:MAG TPA: nitroreductase family protein, partial [Thermoleophilia bacterium]|nr:nitroreductase family protein [Thermoleophilia bacterium]